MNPLAILAALCAVCAACCERPTDQVQQWADQRDVELEQTSAEKGPPGPESAVPSSRTGGPDELSSGDVDWDKEAEEYVHRRYGR